MAEPQGEVSDANALDPDALGFMCGIEVHQQLATGKLHSANPASCTTSPRRPCRTRGREPTVDCGQRAAKAGVDVAARFEAKRRRSFEYVQSPMRASSNSTSAPASARRRRR